MEIARKFYGRFQMEVISGSIMNLMFLMKKNIFAEVGLKIMESDVKTKISYQKDVFLIL